MLHRQSIVIIFTFLAGLSPIAKAIDDQTIVSVSDKYGTSLANIVIELRPVQSNMQGREISELKYNQPGVHKARIEQKEQQFTPHISVVSIDTEITFPNLDNVQHHVYSFSPAKTFEVSLQETFTSAPIKFEEAGIVELGCYIHDWMLAYVFVSDAPWFGQTKSDGKFEMNLPAGDYEVGLWHPRLNDADLERKFVISVQADSRQFTLTLADELLPSLSGYDSVEAVDAY
jgi:plastocyanin